MVEDVLLEVDSVAEYGQLCYILQYEHVQEHFPIREVFFQHVGSEIGGEFEVLQDVLQFVVYEV